MTSTGNKIPDYVLKEEINPKYANGKRLKGAMQFETIERKEIDGKSVIMADGQKLTPKSKAYWEFRVREAKIPEIEWSRLNTHELRHFAKGNGIFEEEGEWALSFSSAKKNTFTEEDIEKLEIHNDYDDYNPRYKEQRQRDPFNPDATIPRDPGWYNGVTGKKATMKEIEEVEQSISRGEALIFEGLREPKKVSISEPPVRPKAPAPKMPSIPEEPIFTEKILKNMEASSKLFNAPKAPKKLTKKQQLAQEKNEEIEIQKDHMQGDSGLSRYLEKKIAQEKNLSVSSPSSSSSKDASQSPEVEMLKMKLEAFSKLFGTL